MSETEQKLLELMKQRDQTEREILILMNDLRMHKVGMTESLVDDEGYPRNDVDIPAIRTLRHQITCKQNDCKMLMKEMEINLHLLHAEAKGRPAASRHSTLPKNAMPFAKVDMVEPHSPSCAADLRPGDLIFKFGSLTSQNFKGMKCIANIVTYSNQKPIDVIVKRENEVVNLILTPQNWAGKGLLGCKLIPLDDVLSGNGP